ncbi:phosphate-starvation-inducible PsiE family protein [Mycolicibacterium septicum]|uniref:phosphate-starvation-inducible PsiE family protein n=1 Tax=Mycolicibacterium septicum TaxID=98668 RepID=UPI0023E23A72|nr:phosphate-starvation-inducible PsiE family protein [Mycolicibacterium septicum]MDF3336455.1 phosphate-starvation-inducible PsiE family protein [Mycolicibacterium septicum]
MAQREETDDEQERERFADRALRIVEDGVYWSIAALLLTGSVVLIIAQVRTLLHLRDSPTTQVMLEMLDGLLLVFIFVELLYAVRTSLRSRELVAEPFLIVGILACIKEIVVVSVDAANLLDKGPEFARAIVQVGVLGALVLVLAIAIFVLRLHRAGADHIRDRPDES